MINLYKIRKSITDTLKYLITAWYGRYILGIILAVVGGVFSPYGTIDFLSTDSEIFTYVAILGMLIITVQGLIMIIAALYLAITNND